ncbi:MAG: glutamate decarboxylase [Desulforudis sp.]|nr:glutamate decarboxylase [Clostridia bacterium]RJX18669.1 MAG: glutamate decarboxylase [Desulforudis sp.]
MWTVVYIAQGKSEADRLMALLCEEGLLVKLRSLGGKDTGDLASVEVLVPAAEVDEALDIIQAL